MVRGSSAPDGPVTALLDGGRGRVYIAGYRKSGDNIEEILPPALISSGKIEDLCRGTWIVTPRWEKWGRETEDWMVTGGENGFIEARWIATLAEDKLVENPVDEVETATPIYLNQYWKNPGAR